MTPAQSEHVNEAVSAERTGAASPRVLMVTGRADFGGGPEHVYQLSRQVNGCVEVFIACPQEEPYWKRYADLVGQHRMLEITHRSVTPAAIWAMMRFIRKHRIQIVHTHGRSAGICGRLAGLATRTRCVHTPHGSTPIDGVQTFAYACVEYAFSLITDGIIAVSTNEATQLRPLCGRRHQPHIIVNGVEIPQKVVSETEAMARPLRILHPTRFVYQKNTELIVPICEELRRLGALERFKFTLFGDGPGRAAFAETLRHSNLDHHVSIFGAVDSLREPLMKSFCVLSTSRWEGMPLALLEAMALGVPVIATDVVGNRDAVSDGESGFLFDPGTPAQAASHVLRLADQRGLWKEFSVSSRRRAELLFSSDAMAARTLSFYHEILRERSGAIKMER